MKQLSDEAYDAVLTWLDQFELSKPARGKTLGRDFSDGGKVHMHSLNTHNPFILFFRFVRCLQFCSLRS